MICRWDTLSNFAVNYFASIYSLFGSPYQEFMSLHNRKFIAVDLIPGQTYRVIVEFKDYDGTIHPVGETWKFRGKNFLPYEDGLSMFVDRDDETIHFRLQWRAESQGEIIRNFSNYVEEE